MLLRFSRPNYSSRLFSLHSHQHHSYQHLPKAFSTEKFLSTNFVEQKSENKQTIFNKQQKQKNENQQNLLIHHLQLIDHYIQCDDPAMVMNTFHQLTPLCEENCILDQHCYQQLLRYSKLDMKFKLQLFSHYSHCYYGDSENYISPILRLGPILLESCISNRRDGGENFDEANLILRQFMHQILQFTNERLNNKQENDYQNLDMKFWREKVEVSIFSQFLNSFFDVCVRKLKRDHLALMDRLFLMEKCENLENSSEKLENLSESGEKCENSIENGENLASLKRLLMNMMENVSLMIEILIRAQLYETERCKIDFCMGNLQYVIQFSHVLNQVFKRESFGENFQQCEENDDQRSKFGAVAHDMVFNEEMKCHFQALVQKKMIHISQYLKERRDKYNDVSSVSSSVASSHGIEEKVEDVDERVYWESVSHLLVSLLRQSSMTTTTMTNNRESMVQHQQLLLLLASPLLNHQHLNGRVNSGQFAFHLDDDLMYNHDSW